MKRQKLVATEQHQKTLHFPSVEPSHIIGGRTKLREGHDFRVIRLDASNVCSNKKKIAKEGKQEGEKLFQGLMGLLRDNFPATEIENEAQYRRYFHDKYGANWFVEVAVDNAGKVIGASLFSYSQDQNVAMYNIVTVDQSSRRKGVGGALVESMIKNAGKMAAKSGAKARFVIGEIEQPDSSYTGAEGKMRNLIRPRFHDNVSKLQAIKLPDGKPLIYLLPIMATDEERREAKESGKPMEPEPLMFCLRSLDGKTTVSAKEVAELLIWFYKDYLEAECSDVKKEEVNNLLAIALYHLSTLTQSEIEALLNSGNRKTIINSIREPELKFANISQVRK